MFYRPQRTLGLLVGALLTFWPAGIAIVLVNFGLTSDIGVGGFLAYAGAALAGVLALVFAYWMYALATLSYALDRNGLIITWGPTRQVIPLGAIERLVPGTAVGVPRVRGVSWWGHHVGSATIERVGPVLFYSTHQTPEQVLYIMTPERSYAISVEDPTEFAHQILRRQELGPTAELSHHVRRERPGLLSVWDDRSGLALAGLAVVAGALVWLQLAVRYDGLPETLALNFPPYETPPLAELVERSALFELPRTASLILGVNIVAGIVIHRWERIVSSLLFAGAAAVQGVFFVALAIAIA